MRRPQRPVPGSPGQAAPSQIEALRGMRTRPICVSTVRKLSSYSSNSPEIAIPPPSVRIFTLSASAAPRTGDQRGDQRGFQYARHLMSPPQFVFLIRGAVLAPRRLCRYAQSVTARGSVLRAHSERRLLPRLQGHGSPPVGRRHSFHRCAAPQVVVFGDAGDHFRGCA